MMLRRFLVAIGLVTLLANSSFAQTAFTGAVDGNWENAGNWTSGLPTTGIGRTLIAGGEDGQPLQGIAPATVNLSSSQTIDEIRIGTRGTGTLNHTAGTLDTDWVFAGVQGTASTPSVGNINLSGTANLDSRGNVQIFGADNPDSQGHLTVADQARFSGNETWVGLNNGAVGTVVQTGGTVDIGPHDDMNANAELRVGGDAGGSGTYTISGGVLNAAQQGMFIGKNDGGVGRLNVNGSSADINLANLAVGGFFDFPNWPMLDVANGVDSTGFGVISFTADAGGVAPIDVDGNVFLGGGTAITEASGLLVDLTAFSGSGAIPLINVGGDAVGEFFNAPQGFANPAWGGRFVSYTAGDGNDIWLVPEPTAGVMAMCGLAMLGFIRRR